MFNWISPQTEVYQVLCVATRDGFSCTLEQHDGQHEAWGEEDLCASWTDEGEFAIHPEGAIGKPGRLGDYIDAVLAPRAPRAAGEAVLV
jgi:hypothetical protein